MSTLSQGAGPNPPGSKVYRLLREYGGLAEKHFQGKLPDSLVSRIVSGNSSRPYAFLGSADPASPLAWDIAAGIVHGYEKRPEILDTWMGTGFADLADHAVNVGGFPIAVPLFGLDAEVAAVVGMRDLHDIAGAARLAVKDSTISDMPPNLGATGPKYTARSAPPLETNLTIRKSLMFASFPSFIPLIELMGDTDVDELHASLQRVRSSRGTEAATLGYVAALMVRAEREKLSLAEVFRVWSLVQRDADFVIEAVRNGVPDEYLMSLVSAD